MADLVAENRRRTKLDPEYELLDTGAFDDDRYWWIEAEFAKATPDDVYVKVTVGNAGPEPATIDVLPTLWFRNTWAWGIDPRKPTLSTQAGFVFAEHHELGRYVLELEGDPELLFCDNETNTTRLWGVPGPAYPKDGINDHVVHGAATINPDRVGTKMAARYRLTVAPGETAEVRFTLGPGTSREEETVGRDLGRTSRRGRLASTNGSRRTARPKTRHGCCGRPSQGCCGRSSSSTSTSTGGSSATRRCRRRRPSG